MSKASPAIYRTDCRVFSQSIKARHSEAGLFRSALSSPTLLAGSSVRLCFIWPRTIPGIKGAARRSSSVGPDTSVCIGAEPRVRLRAFRDGEDISHPAGRAAIQTATSGLVTWAGTKCHAMHGLRTAHRRRLQIGHHTLRCVSATSAPTWSIFTTRSRHALPCALPDKDQFADQATDFLGSFNPDFGRFRVGFGP